MGTGGQPNWEGWLSSIWGWPVEYGGEFPLLAYASNIVYGTNPPYTIQDFFGIYPAFGGVPVLQQTTTVSGSNTVTISDVSNIAVGNPVAGPGIPNGAYISAIAGNVLTLMVGIVPAKATASATNIPFTIWNATKVPVPAINAYIYLATSSLVQARWQEMWTMAIALYVAHFATLYAKSAANPGATTSQIAAQGLAFGIVASKSVHDVSISYSPVQGLEDWGAFNLTSFGQQLATFARVIGSGPCLIY